MLTPIQMRTKTKWKRTLVASGLVAGLSSILIVAGCASDTEGNAGSGKEGDASHTEAASNQQGASEESTKARGSISVAIYDRGNIPADEGTIENNRWTRYMNENGPVDVKYVAIPRFDSIAKYNTLFASSSAPDLIFEYDSNYRDQLYQQKQLLPIDDELLKTYAPDYYDYLEQYPLMRKIGTKEDGQLYELGAVGTMLPNHVLFIRKDWLDALHLPIPQTTEELFQTAKAFAEQDPDGNGKDDTYGFSLSFVSGMMLDYMFGNVFTIYEKYPWYIQEDELVHDWERSAAAVSYKKRIYDEGLVDKDFLTDTKGEKAKQDWVNGKLGIYGANGGFNDVTMYEALMNVNPDAEIVPIALPESEFGQFSPALTTPIRKTAAINASAKDPGAVLEYVNFLIQPETTTTLSFGIEGEHFERKENGCPIAINPEKRKQEMGYQGDMNMLNWRDVQNPECFGVTAYLNPDMSSLSEAAAGLAKLRVDGYALYVNKETPLPLYTMMDYMPSMPQDLQMLNTNALNAIQDIWVKAIIGGTSYTVDQAVADAKAAWDRAGGERVDDWYKQWYQENKETAILTEDIYSLTGN
ncbi:extracellular solute-binding protein [Paenibacillus sp. IB182496]|uniref:Extracellular solute-binding protein n=1 Tax=Paenibacillus sabuli TaxID=2772509 RepID=A0A927GU55_9BACL|nr:extracellular solute-binding protein [Paenibacillus sabuli]MBD2847800.1 extracellular solute-binding protein [Paenibacillus sabuli]